MGENAKVGFWAFMVGLAYAEPLAAGAWPFFGVWWLLSPKLRAMLNPHKIAVKKEAKNP